MSAEFSNTRIEPIGQVFAARKILHFISICDLFNIDKTALKFSGNYF